MIRVVFFENKESGIIQGQPIEKEVDLEFNGPLTLALCREIIGILRRNWQLEPDCIGIDLGDGHFATHNVSQNCLRIWKDGFPVSEDKNGLICKDGITILEYMMR